MLKRISGIFTTRNANANLKPCPTCGHYPVVTVTHTELWVKCKEGCYSVHMSNTQNSPNFTSNDFAELTWQWNNIVSNVLKNGSDNKPKTLQYHGSSEIKCTPEQSYGFGKYFIEHPDGGKNYEGNTSESY